MAHLVGVDYECHLLKKSVILFWTLHVLAGSIVKSIYLPSRLSTVFVLEWRSGDLGVWYSDLGVFNTTFLSNFGVTICVFSFWPSDTDRLGVIFSLRLVLMVFRPTSVFFCLRRFTSTFPVSIPPLPETVSEVAGFCSVQGVWGVIGVTGGGIGSSLTALLLTQ